MKYLTLIILLTCCACDNKKPLPVSRVVNKSGKIIKLYNVKDTLILGDTIGIEYLLPSPLILGKDSFNVPYYVFYVKPK